VSPVKYELGFYIPEDDILHTYTFFAFVFSPMSVYAILGIIKRELILQLLNHITTNFTLHSRALTGRDNTIRGVSGHEADSHGSIPDKAINCLRRFHQPGPDGCPSETSRAGITGQRSSAVEPPPPPPGCIFIMLT
jgi:hypothetical protein